MKNIIFITGASSDIGIALIKSIKEKCIVVAHYNTSKLKLLKLQNDIKNTIIPVKADFSSERSIKDMLDYIETKIGIPNKIIHLAAPKFKNLRFKNIDWGNFQNEINISLGSITIILNRFLPRIPKERKGRVITMLSSVVLGVPPIKFSLKI